MEGIVANATKAPYVMRTYDTKLAEFLTSLQLERGASPHTIEAYKRDLIDLGDFVEHVDPDQIEVGVLDDYALALQDRGLSPATVRRRLAAVRAFLKYRAREGGRPDAGRSVPLPRLGRRLAGPPAPPQAAGAADAAGGGGDRDQSGRIPARPPRPRHAGADVRRRPAGLRAGVPAGVRHRSRGGAGALHGQGRQAAGSADRRPCDRGDPHLHATRPPVPGPHAARRYPVPEPSRPGHHPPGRLPAGARARPRGGYREDRDSAHAAPLV